MKRAIYAAAILILACGTAYANADDAIRFYSIGAGLAQNGWLKGFSIDERQHIFHGAMDHETIYTKEQVAPAICKLAHRVLENADAWQVWVSYAGLHPPGEEFQGITKVHCGGNPS